MDKGSPIAVFDSGVGSYSVVRLIQKFLPQENIIYLADRASFPYGGKTHDELKLTVDKTISYLEKHYQPKIIVVASNTPSIQVLGELEKSHQTKLIGVYPPVVEAVKKSSTKHVGILATKGAVESTEIDDFIKEENLPAKAVVLKVNASDLVALVEPGTFQENRDLTKVTIKSVIDPLLASDSLVDVMTLSSTHLPFLKDYLTEMYPNILFLDPAEKVATEIKENLEENNALLDNGGSIVVLTTVDEEGKLKPVDLKKILNNLGLNTGVEVVKI